MFTGNITTSSCTEKTQRAYLSGSAVFLFKQRVILKPKDCHFAQKTGLRFDLRLQHICRRENLFPQAT